MTRLVSLKDVFKLFCLSNSPKANHIQFLMLYNRKMQKYSLISKSAINKCVNIFPNKQVGAEWKTSKAKIM